MPDAYHINAVESNFQGNASAEAIIHARCYNDVLPGLQKISETSSRRQSSWVSVTIGSTSGVPVGVCHFETSDIGKRNGS